jgi:HAD superfamily hydrolase (TIGR01509 family)
MNKVPLIIFDCDGVLIDSEIIAARVQSRILRQSGISITPEDVARRFSGIPDKDMWASLQIEHEVNLPSELPEQYGEALGLAFQHELRSLPGVNQALEALKERGLRSCVASSSTPAKLMNALQQVGLWDYFAPNIFSTTQVAKGKPSPDIFLFAAEQMAVDPKLCLVIEDSVAGVQAARSAGMSVFGYVGASHDEPDQSQRLIEAGATDIFSDMARLPMYLARAFNGDVQPSTACPGR